MQTTDRTALVFSEIGNTPRDFEIDDFDHDEKLFLRFDARGGGSGPEGYFSYHAG